MEKKKEMMRLWKDTFHDSDEYIQLVFDAYYDPEYCLTYEDNGRVVAALMGVPYTFHNRENCIHIRALYLCGLSTEPSYRRKGIMSKLIEEITQRAIMNGFCILFLIPANDGLRKYYHDRGFVDNFYQRYDNYVAGHYFSTLANMPIDDSDEETHLIELIKSNKIFKRVSINMFTHDTNTLKKIIQRLQLSEMCSRYPSLLHSYMDWCVVIKESLLSDNRVYYIQDYQGKICSVLFLKDVEKDSITVQYVASESYQDKLDILQVVRNIFEKKGITIICRDCHLNITQYEDEYYFDEGDEDDWDNEWSEDKDADDDEDGEDEEEDESDYLKAIPSTVDANRLFHSYGMVRILDNYEILKFVSKGTKSLKYLILVKEDKEGKMLAKYRCDGGEVSKELVPEEGNIGVVMDSQDLAEFLCRAPRTDDYVKEAFGLPRLDLQIMLLLE